ncbi:MAG: DMT family transporter [Muribaculaceae bacterium]|nr:DMT family transporter [Muribaculaceae bacterium]
MANTTPPAPQSGTSATSATPTGGTPTGASTRHNALLIGNLLALSASICWGFNEPANKYLIPTWISAPGVALCRIFGATAIIWLLSLFVKRQKIRHSDWRLLWGAALMMLGFVYVFSLAFITASPIDIAIILTFQPLLVVGINALFRHRHISVLTWIGMAIAFGGALMVILAGGDLGDGRIVGDLFACVCAVTYSCYLVIIEGPSARYGTLNLMKWVFLFTSVLSLPLIFTVGRHIRLLMHSTFTPWGVLGFIVLFPTVYCYIVTPPALRRVGSGIFSFYQYLVPVIATVVSVLFRLDTFHWYQPVSFVIIVAGVMLANYGKARDTRP